MLFLLRSVSRFLGRPSAVRCALALGLGAIIPLAAPAQVAATGTIEGHVANAGTGNYLNNAQVTIVGTTRETFTNRFGLFRFTDVPAGDVQLRIFYTGLAPETRAVTVTAGQVAQQDVTLAADTLKLDKFVVEAQKEVTGASI